MYFPDDLRFAALPDDQRQALLDDARDRVARAKADAANLHTAEAAAVIRRAMPDAATVRFQWVSEVPGHTGEGVRLEDVRDRDGTPLATARMDSGRVGELLTDAYTFSGAGYFGYDEAADLLQVDLDEALRTMPGGEVPKPGDGHRFVPPQDRQWEDRDCRLCAGWARDHVWLTYDGVPVVEGLRVLTNDWVWGGVIKPNDHMSGGEMWHRVRLDSGREAIYDAGRMTTRPPADAPADPRAARGVS